MWRVEGKSLLEEALKAIINSEFGITLQRRKKIIELIWQSFYVTMHLF